MRSGFGEVMVVVLVLSMGFVGGVYTTYELSSLGSQADTVYKPSYNLTVPESAINVKSDDNMRTVGNRGSYSSSTTNYIQATYTDVEYSIGDEEAEVSIDAVARPEGKSMRPTIFSGNTVLLEEYEGGEISEGEILRYETDTGYVIHRVQANYLSTSDYLLMRGDNNEHSSRIDQKQITHRVVGILYTDSSSKSTNLAN